MRVKVTIVEGARDLELPRYETSLSAGMDLRANIDNDVIIKPNEIKVIPAGIRVEIPDGYEIQVRPRSGLAAKHGITVVNAPGTIDADFRGEIKVILINLGDKEFIVHRGDRIAQMVCNKVERMEFEVVDSLSSTDRGEGELGHTGLK